MPLATLGVLTQRLLAAGADLELPMCAVFNATRPDERIVSGTLATIHPLVQAAKVRGPCLVLIGPALHALRSKREGDREPVAAIAARVCNAP
jgi:siroheme synthase